MSNIKNREQLLNDPSVLQQIQERAYFIAESTGFTPGRDHDNWVTAEEEVLAKLTFNGTANGATNGVTTDAINGVANPVKAKSKKAIVNPAESVTASPKTTARSKAAAAKIAVPNVTEVPTTVEAPISPATAPAKPKRAPKKSA